MNEEKVIKFGLRKGKLIVSKEFDYTGGLLSEEDLTSREIEVVVEMRVGDKVTEFHGILKERKE